MTECSLDVVIPEIQELRR